MRRELRVLVVDDSAFNRKRIGEILTSIDGVTVVGKAADGEEALRMLSALDPDLVTLDLEMPRMDGFSFLRFVRTRSTVPVIVVSSHGAKQNVFRALELGALDFVVKPGAAPGEKLSIIRDDLVQKVKMVQSLRPMVRRLEKPRTVTSLLRSVGQDDTRPPPPQDTPRRLIVIVSSTGGPSALVELFSALRSDCTAAVLVVQHMPTRFTSTFAERLDRLGGIRVMEAADGDRLRAGHALVCPGGRCVDVRRVREGFAVQVGAQDPEDRYVPSGDRALRTAAEAAHKRLVAVVLTGMGDDGASSLAAVQAAGGKVLVQLPREALIDGMPRSAVASGHVDETLTLTRLGERLRELSGPEGSAR